MLRDILTVRRQDEQGNSTHRSILLSCPNDLDLYRRLASSLIAILYNSYEKRDAERFRTEDVRSI